MLCSIRETEEKHNNKLHSQRTSKVEEEEAMA